MIYLKIILAFLLSAVPFLYVTLIKPKRETSSVWRNMFTAIGSQLPRLKAVKTACSKFLHRLYEGMKRSDNFRKFFTLITLLLMIAVQFIDFSASIEIARGIREISQSDAETYGEIETRIAHTIAVYGSLMSKPHATVLAACLSMTLFVFGSANWLLTRLHNSRKFFFFIALVTLIILFTSPRYFIVVEIMEMMLMAALIYPNKIATPDTKGRKGIPNGQNKISFKNAA